jgi:hypothetical protein
MLILASYLECRASIYQHITFTICSTSAAYDFLLTRQNPIHAEIRFLNLSLIFPGIGWLCEDDAPDNARMRRHEAEITMWELLKATLAAMQHLVEANV